MINFKTTLKRTLSTRTSDDKCTVCNEKTEEENRISLGGATFHHACFRCANCGESLLSTPYGLLDGLYYCKPHFQEMQKAKSDPNYSARSSRTPVRIPLPTERSASPSSGSLSNTATTSSSITSPPATPGKYGRKPILVATILNASGLLNVAGSNVNSFVTLVLRGKLSQTPVVSGTKPDWNYTVDLQANERDDLLKIQVWHQEDGVLPDILGQASVTVGEILDKVEQTNYYEFSHKLKVSGTEHGELRIGYKVRYALTDKDEENRLFAERFDKFLDVARYSVNDKKVLSSFRLDEKKKKLKEICSSKAKEYSTYIKNNKNVPKYIVTDLKNLLSEKNFLRSFVHGEGNIDALVLFLANPHVVDIPVKPSPDTIPSTAQSGFLSPRSDSIKITSPRDNLTSPRIDSARRGLMRTASVPASKPFSPRDEPQKIEAGLSYVVSGRSATGGGVGKPCIFTVTFLMDGVPIQDPLKDDLHVAFECPGDGLPAPLINVGSGGNYQIGLTPKAAGQHWLDFKFRGEWCKEPFLLPVKNSMNQVPDFPYTGFERRNAPESSDDRSRMPSTPIKLSIAEEGTPPSSPYSLTDTVNEEETFPDVKVEDQKQTRLFVMEIFRDFIFTRLSGVASCLHPNFLESLSRIVTQATDPKRQLLISFLALLTVIPSATSTFDTITWDGTRTVINVLKNLQGKDRNPFELLVELLNTTDNPTFAATVLVLINVILDCDKEEEKNELKAQLIACDFLAAVRSLKLKFARSESIRIQIALFESDSASQSEAGKKSELSVQSIAQAILDNNDNSVGSSFINILKGLIQFPKDADSLRKWQLVEHLVIQLKDPNWRSKNVRIFGNEVALTSLLADIEKLIKEEYSVKEENIAKTAEIERLNKICEELRAKLNLPSEGAIQPTPKARTREKKENSGLIAYKGPKPSKPLKTIPWRDCDDTSEISSTIFTELDPNKVKLDVELLEKLFAKASDAKITLLSQSRNSEILQNLQQLDNDPKIQPKLLEGQSLAEIVKAISSDVNESSVETIRSVLSALPTYDERDTLQEWISQNPQEDPKTVLSSVDFFQLSVLADGDVLESRFKALDFFNSCKKELNQIRQIVSVAKACEDVVLSNSEISRILEIVLAILNFVNSKKGTSSFHIGLLNELQNISTNNYSLLDYLIKIIDKEDPSLFTWTDKVFVLHSASKVSFSKLNNSLESLIIKGELIKDIINNTSSPEFTNIFSQYSTDIEDMSFQIQQNQEGWNYVAKAYGMKEGDAPLVFDVFASFSESFKLAVTRFKSGGVSFQSSNSGHTAAAAAAVGSIDIESVKKLLINRSNDSFKHLQKTTPSFSTSAPSGKPKNSKLSQNLIGNLVLLGKKSSK